MKYTQEVIDYIGKLFIEENKSKQEISEITNIPKENIKYILRKGNIVKSKEQQVACKKRILMDKYGVDAPLKNKDVLNKMKQTNLERYGYENPMQNKDIQQKAINTNLEKYGVEYLMQNDEIKAKSKQTSLERYGVDAPMKLEAIKQKQLETVRQRYGADNPMQVPEIRQKVFTTNLEKYGSISPFGNKEIREKIKQNNLKKYGVEYPVSTSDVKDKKKQTNLDKYGSVTPFGNKEIQKKVKQEFLTKYGVENALQSDIVRNKIHETNLEKYGSISPFGDKDVQEKIKNTNLERYGVEYSIRDENIRNKIVQSNIANNCPNYDLLRDKDRLIEFLLSVDKEKRTSIYCAEKLGVNVSTLLAWVSKHNIRNEVSLVANRSHFEQDIIDWIKSFYSGEIANNTREFKKYEIDIYLKELNLGIEFNGLYWHSDTFIPHKYHQNKSLYFKDKNIFIVHIYEWEWLNPKMQEKIMIYLKNLILDERQTVYARKCKVNEIDTKIYRDFLEEYHLQGFIGAETKLGLYYNGKLVQVMSFGKGRFGVKSTELLRLCTHKDYKVVGGAEKLFHYYIKKYNPTQVVSYCNIDKFQGNVYYRLGMKCDKINPPNYVWINSSTLDIKSRYQTQRHLIVSDECDTRTESEIMRDLGYLKVEDAGTYKFVWEKEVDENEDKIN